MKKRKNIDEEVERTMHSLDGLERAETDPFFYSRLEARLGKQRESSGIFTSLWAEPRYLFVTAAITLVILFNIFSAAEYQQYYQQESVQQSSEISAFVDEYELNVPVWYNANEKENGY